MNMLLFLTLTSFGDWGYDGFVADPAPPAPAPPKAIVPEPSVRVVSSDRPKVKLDIPPALAPPALEAKTPPVAAPSQPPRRWRLADSTGQLWEFHDPEKLKEWVTARNAPPSSNTPAQTFAAPPMFFGGSSCASGQCYGR